MNLIDILKRAFGLGDPAGAEPASEPVMAQLTIISTDQSASGSRSSRPRG